MLNYTVRIHHSDVENPKTSGIMTIQEYAVMYGEAVIVVCRRRLAAIGIADLLNADKECQFEQVDEQLTA